MLPTHIIPVLLVTLVRTVLLVNISYLVFVFTDTYTQKSLAWTAAIFFLFVILAYVSVYRKTKMPLTTQQLMLLLIVPIVGAFIFSASEGGPSISTFLYLIFGGLYLPIWSGAYRPKNTLHAALWMVPVQTAISFAIAGFDSIPLIIVSIGLIFVALAECHTTARIAQLDVRYRGMFFFAVLIAPLVCYSLITLSILSLPILATYLSVLMLSHLLYHSTKKGPFRFEYSNMRMIWIGIPLLGVALAILFLVGNEYRLAVYSALFLTTMGAFYIYGWMLRDRVPRHG